MFCAKQESVRAQFDLCADAFVLFNRIPFTALSVKRRGAVCAILDKRREEKRKKFVHLTKKRAGRGFFLDGAAGPGYNAAIGTSKGAAAPPGGRQRFFHISIDRPDKEASYEPYSFSAAPVHHVGVSRFQTTWTSEVEKEALRWAEKELGYI